METASATSVYDTYETVIGLEIHVQLSTASKAFCADGAAYGADPNTQVSVISLGHPGTLPRLNKQQIEYAIRLGYALDSAINRRSTFDRKNYFYADLPKGYQITQDRQPICVGGSLTISVGEEEKEIRIHHVHMEEDAGKSSHEGENPYSFIDLNRAGVPLLEIVSEPDLRSAEEVDVYMSAMRQLVRYLGISDGNMQEGSMRCDCNVSVRKKGATKLGERCEIKNLNSMRYARKAIAYEVKRQIDLLESGGKVAQQTLNFDPATGVTSPLRAKEDAHDYRYFPEPDLPPVVVSEEELKRIKKELPSLPWELLAELKENFGLSAYDAGILTAEAASGHYFKALAKVAKDNKAVANLIINKILPYCQEEGTDIDAFPIALTSLAELIQLIKEGQVSNTVAYQKLFPLMLAVPQQSPKALAEEHQLIQSTDTDFLEGVVDEVLAAFPDKVATYRKGKKGLLGFFMGEVMKRSKGQAEPRRTNELLREKLA